VRPAPATAEEIAILRDLGERPRAGKLPERRRQAGGRLEVMLNFVFEDDLPTLGRLMVLGGFLQWRPRSLLSA
jgi:hypothetical protein